MRIYFKGPFGLAFLLEWEPVRRRPMEMDKFRLLCYLSGAAIAAGTFVAFAAIVAGR